VNNSGVSSVGGSANGASVIASGTDGTMMTMIDADLGAASGCAVDIQWCRSCGRWWPWATLR
jgi:hypothetical protein